MSSFPEFRVADALWDAWMCDPHIRGEIERLIEERRGEEIRREVEREKTAWRQTVQEAARQEGYEAGKREAAGELERLKGDLSRVCDALRNQERQVLVRQEAAWIRAFGELARQFLVRRDGELVDRIRVWIRDHLEGVEERSRIRVFLSPQEYRRLSTRMTATSDDRWSWESDPELKDGEVRCESDVGGLMFSPPEEWAKLNELVRKHIEGESVEA